nr:MAG TPA: hypothetical protein [Caudoviricetes sp.]
MIKLHEPFSFLQRIHYIGVVNYVITNYRHYS